MPIIRLQVIPTYVHWHCSIDYCMALISKQIIFLLNSFKKHLRFEEQPQVDGKKMNFETFESTFCMKSGSMSLPNPCFAGYTYSLEKGKRTLSIKIFLA